MIVDGALLDSVLTPYKLDCRYLKQAIVEVGGPDGTVATIRGELGIPHSCYIDDTGHFNSVEFNICYNQLVYVLMAQLVVSEVTPYFAAMSLGEYLERQLPDVLIHDFSSKFKRPLDMRRFGGRVTIRTTAKRSRFLFVRTECEFADDAGGAARGDVTLAIVDRPAATVESPARAREA